MARNKFPETQKDIELAYERFARFFWWCFIVKAGGYVVGYASEDLTTQLIAVVVQLLAVLATVGLFSYYIYVFSRKPWAALWGVFGFLWIGLWTIALGFNIVKRQKDNALKNVQPIPEAVS